MPYLPTIIVLACGLVVLLLLVLHVARAVRRFSRVRGWLEDYLDDRVGLLRARGAALRVAAGESDLLTRRGAPRTISSSVEQEDHRA